MAKNRNREKTLERIVVGGNIYFVEAETIHSDFSDDELEMILNDSPPEVPTSERPILVDN